jgi:hypothetical protein
MLSLLELQREFAAALLGGDGRSLEQSIVGASALSPESALGIYRNNVLGNYRKALRDDYPAVLALVGERFFNGACDAYARSRGSRSGDLNDFGDAFAAFLTDWPPAQELVYLCDVARLEWAMHLASNAADAPAFQIENLAPVPPERVHTLRFVLHPSAHLVSSAYPILRIWRLSTADATTDERVALDAGAECLLVIRRQSGVEIEPLAPGEGSALQALSEDCDLAQAHARALAADTDFDLTAFLQRHVSARTIVSFHLP